MKTIIIFLAGLGAGIGLSQGYHQFKWQEHRVTEATSELSIARQHDAASLFGAVASEKSAVSSSSFRVPVAPKATVDRQTSLELNESAALKKLSQAVAQQKFQVALNLYDQVRWYHFLPQALGLRLQAITSMATEHYKAERFEQAIFLLEGQLSLTSGEAQLYQLKAQVLMAWGYIDPALETLRVGLQLVSSSVGQEQLSSAVYSIMRQQFQFYVENALWRELIDFALNESVEWNDQFYTIYHQTLARAYAHLYDWENADYHLGQAEQSLAVTSELVVLKSYINTLKAKEQVINANLRLEAEGWVSVPIELRGTAVIVTLQIVGINSNKSSPIRVMIDTGATLTTLNQELMEAWLSQNAGSYSAKTAKLFMTAGGRVTAPVYSLKALIFDRFTFPDIEVAALTAFDSSSDVKGLLGMNVLRHFEFSIDLEQKMLRLRQK